MRRLAERSLKLLASRLRACLFRGLRSDRASQNGSAHRGGLVRGSAREDSPRTVTDQYLARITATVEPGSIRRSMPSTAVTGCPADGR
jgi:hypothetical protein